MISEQELRHSRRRTWFLDIKDRNNEIIDTRKVISLIEAFASKHLNSRWAINPGYRDEDGLYSCRVVVIMKNTCSLQSISKAVKNLDCSFDFNAKSIWSFLCGDGSFSKDTVITSQNWGWDGFVMRNREGVEDCRKRQNFTIRINNLFVLTDEEGRKALLDVLRN